MPSPEKVASLKTIHRFVDDWQGPASLALRAGDRRAVETYTARGAVQAGTQEEVLDQVHAAWASETAQGRTSLMVAADNATAAELAARARADLKAAGKVGGREVTLADGNTASAGDLIVTRKNARALRSGRHWAHNGATWHVQAVSADGAMLVTPTATRLRRRSTCPPTTSPPRSSSATPAPSTAPRAAPWTTATSWSPPTWAARASTSA